MKGLLGEVEPSEVSPPIPEPKFKRPEVKPPTLTETKFTEVKPTLTETDVLKTTVAPEVVPEFPMTGLADTLLSSATRAGAIVGDMVLQGAAFLAIGVAIGLLDDWLERYLGLDDESKMKRDVGALKPQIQARLQKLGRKITQLQQHGKVYCRIIYDVASIERLGEAFGEYHETYKGSSLVDVEVTGEPLENSQHTEYREDGKHNLLTVYTLYDDPQKREAQKQIPELVEHLRQLTPKTPQPPPPPPSPAQLARVLPPVTTVESDTKAELVHSPFASPEQEAKDPVALVRKEAKDLLDFGERLYSGSPGDRDDFKRREDEWRTKVTILKHVFILKHNEEGQKWTQELLDSGEYGGRLTFLRKYFGG